MTTSTTDPREAFAAYRAAQAQAVNLPDDGTLSPLGRVRAQAAILQPAREALAAAIPALPEAAVADPVAPVLAARRPRTADDVAVQGREREKVRAMIAAGRNLAQIIAQADEPRLAAILDGLDDDPEVLGSSHPDAAAAEVRERIFARLVAVGADDAVQAAAELREVQTVSAWHATLSELHDSPNGLSIRARTALHAADPEGYAATVAADAQRPDAESAVRLDRETARILHADASAPDDAAQA